MKKLVALLCAAAICLMASAQRIAVLSDVHVTPGNKNETQLVKAVDEINEGNFDIVILNGDLSNEGSDVELANVKSIIDGIKHPLFVLPGNHENNWSQSATKTFVDLFGADRFVTRIDSLAIVGINCGPYMKMGDGHIKQEDLHWLRSTLDSLCAVPGTKVLSFNHYPIRKDDLDNYADYANLLLQYPVIGHINGHYHSWIRYEVGSINAAMTRALDMGRGENFGYSIIEVSPQWTLIYDKQLGQEPKAMFAWSNTNPATAEAPSNASDIAFDSNGMMVDSPAGFEVQKVWADSASIFTRLSFDPDRVFFGTSLGQARAIDKSGRSLAWEIPLGASLFSRHTPLNKGRIAIPYSAGIIIADASTGRIISDMPSPEGPYVADGILASDAYIQGAYKRLERRNPTSGKLVWSYDSINNYCQAAPVVDGSDVIFGAWDSYLRCLDLKTGKLKWKWNNGREVNMLGPGNVVPVVTDNKVIIVAPDRYMTAIDRKTGQQLWRDNSHRYRESLGHSADGKIVYAKTMDGELVAVDATTADFNELWTINMGLGYDHAPCIVAEQDGIVYAGSRRGLVTAVDPSTRQVLWQLPLGSSEINGIDIDPTDQSVWVSLIEGTIFKITRLPQH